MYVQGVIHEPRSWSSWRGGNLLTAGLISATGNITGNYFIGNYLKENNKFNKYEIGEALYSQLFKNCCTEEEIKEYVETRKLKRYVKKYNLSKKINNK